VKGEGTMQEYIQKEGQSEISSSSIAVEKNSKGFTYSVKLYMKESTDTEIEITLNKMDYIFQKLAERYK